MKLQARNHVKFLRLKRRLGVPQWQVVGLLESIWLLTIDNAPAGDIGRMSNDDIAVMIEYNDDADDLIAALVETGWLDTHEEHRLIVHDWSDHCPNYLVGNFARHRRQFVDAATKQVPKQPAKHGAKQPAKKLRQAKPSLTKPDTSSADADVSAGFEDFWAAWPQHHRKTARAQCLKKWRAKGLADRREQVMAGLERSKRSPEWTKDGGQYIPAPLTWLNQDRWEAPADPIDPSCKGVADAVNDGRLPVVNWPQEASPAKARFNEQGVHLKSGTTTVHTIVEADLPAVIQAGRIELPEARPLALGGAA